MAFFGLVDSDYVDSSLESPFWVHNGSYPHLLLPVSVYVYCQKCASQSVATGFRAIRAFVIVKITWFTDMDKINLGFDLNLIAKWLFDRL